MDSRTDVILEAVIPGHHHGWVDKSGQLSWASSSWLTIPRDVFQSCWLYLSTQRPDLFPGVRYSRGLCLRMLTWLWFTSLAASQNHLDSLKRNYREPRLLRFWLIRFQTRRGRFSVKEPRVWPQWSVRTGHHCPPHPHCAAGHRTGSLCTSWECIQNADSQAAPGRFPHQDLLFHKVCRWFLCMWRFEKPCSPMLCCVISA